MSELSYLEKLLDGVEVEWVTLGSMADIGTGSSNRQDESENGIYPFYVRSKNILKSDTFEFDEVAIVIPGEGGIGDIFHYVEGEYALHQRAYRIRITTNAVDTKFLYYFMSSSFKQYILTKSVGATAISIRKPMLEGFKVPIPSPDNQEKSLAIQSEIVRILDKFTALTAELTAELTMRKKQYNYYRDQLLSFKEGEVEWKTLDDVFDIVAGGDAPKDALSEFETEEFSIPVLSNGIGNKSLYGWTDRAKIEKPSLTISARGTIGWTSYRSRPFFPIVRLLVLTPKIKLNLKYAYYFMKTIENNYKIPEAGIPQLTKPMLKDIKIPFPCPGNPEESYNEQARIAATLDKFDVLTNSITEGLPREIELRQKQYEYYRDLLFSFPKPETASN
ncbi:restriction endonuclease subunit S [Klebsiella quasipneumoniae]|uniref:restriction endonuclease subunit S n=1 Tax=Klebsiella quasipneumoniae TaxID=1463165 RepID=UPI0009B940CA|nr:restriction endonuclease subunit S [Klebsiella quasipneumoniae]SLQ68287.1 Restriction modification system DNA specificity domain protein [Klebsiella quasipneumoniae]